MGLFVPVGSGVHDSLQIAHAFAVREGLKDGSGCSVVIHLQISQGRVDVLVFLQESNSSFIVPVLESRYAILVLRVVGIQALVYKGREAADVR